MPRYLCAGLAVQLQFYIVLSTCPDRTSAVSENIRAEGALPLHLFP